MRATNVGSNWSCPHMLISEPVVGLVHRLLGCEVCLFFLWKSCYQCSDLSIVRIRNGKVSVVPGFLHPLNREIEPRNPTKHVSITALQVHELLEAVEEYIGCAVHDERPQETLEVLNSVVRVLQAISICQEAFYDFYESLLHLPNGCAKLVLVYPCPTK